MVIRFFVWVDRIALKIMAGATYSDLADKTCEISFA